MKFINRARANGKTIMLVHTSYVTGYPIVVYSNRMKENVLKVADELNCNVEVFTAAEFRFMRPKLHNKILLDEGDSIINSALTEYFECDVIATTMTMPMECENE